MNSNHVYTLSLHDALPIFRSDRKTHLRNAGRKDFPCATHSPISQAHGDRRAVAKSVSAWRKENRSEEHTSELQSRGHLVCRLLLEKKSKIDPSAPDYDMTW